MKLILVVPLFVLFQFLSFIECTVRFRYDTPPEHVLKTEGGRVRGIQDLEGKDIILGGLFSVHLSSAAGGQCGTTLRLKGTERLEAMLYAIDLVNSDPYLLPNITIGYDIRDTCMSENIGLDESIEFVSSEDLCHDTNLSNTTTLKSTITAVIGATLSIVSIPVASLFRLFNLPQVSFSSTSPILNHRDRFTYFFRTVPPDDQQAQAMIDLIVYFGWGYVSTIYSNNVYGQPGIDEFHRLAKIENICIDLNEGINENFVTADYTVLANKLFNSFANVVVLFAYENHVIDLMTEIKSVQGNSRRQFLWIASDSWATFREAADFSSIVSGMWGVAPLTTKYDLFEEYYSNLTLGTNLRNSFFTEYYQVFYNCIVGINCTNDSITEHPTYEQNPKVPLVVDAVYSIAHALNNFFKENCDQPLVWYKINQTCVGRTNETKLNGKVLLKYLSKVSFTSPTGNKVSFNKFGNVESNYIFYNYQSKLSCSNCSSMNEFVQVAYWNGSINTSQERITFTPNIQIQFGLNKSGHIIHEFNSQCQACKPGFFRRKVVSSCCGICDPCLGQNYTNSTSSTECQLCPQYMWGNDPLNGSNGCIDIEESYLKPSDGWSIVLILLAIIGLLAVVFVSGVFIYFWNTPIVKSSGREQMALLLIGITLCFLITVVFILKPSVVVCTLQRISAFFCSSLVISSLFIKLVRITRIFLHKNITTRPKYISPIFQILFTFILVGVLMFFEIISLSVFNPRVNNKVETNENNHNDFPVIIVRCSTPHISVLVIQLLYYTTLMITSNALAILTIRFPQNFNESKYIAFSTFSLGLIWLAFLFLFGILGTELHVALVSLAIQLSALAVLVCVFGPRAFIMIVWPSRNAITSSATNATTPSVTTGLQMTKIPTEHRKVSLVPTVASNADTNGN